MKNAAVLEKAADDTAHPYAVAHPAYSRTQSAYTTDDQINLHSRLRSAIQGHDDVLVEQGIDLGNNAGWASVTRMVGFAFDQPEASLCQVQRRHQQRLVVGMLGVGGEKTENIMHRSRDFRIGGEQAQVG